MSDRSWAWLTGGGHLPPADPLPDADAGAALTDLMSRCRHAADQLGDDAPGDDGEVCLSLGEVATMLVAAGVDLDTGPGDPHTRAVGQRLRELGHRCQRAAAPFARTATAAAGPAERDQAAAALRETVDVLRCLLNEPTTDLT